MTGAELNYLRRYGRGGRLRFGGWTPIGAEQTAGGYDVAWKIPGADQYTVWSTDSNGNYISNTHRSSIPALALHWNCWRPLSIRT